MIKVCEEKKNCCGCTACMHICPVDAIGMREDEEGFVYPSVDKEKCIECGKCVAVCPFLTDAERKTDVRQQYYAVKHKNNEIIEKSSSGGGVYCNIGCHITESRRHIWGGFYRRSCDKA